MSKLMRELPIWTTYTCKNINHPDFYLFVTHTIFEVELSFLFISVYNRIWKLKLVFIIWMSFLRWYNVTSKQWSLWKSNTPSFFYKKMAKLNFIAWFSKIAIFLICLKGIFFGIFLNLCFPTYEINSYTMFGLQLKFLTFLTFV